jgi:SPP1 family phage portal protein
MYTGRKEIYTDVREITSENLIEVLQKAMITFSTNVTETNYLINYEKGVQPLTRTKKYRADINCECIDNIANEITDFKLGFQWANPTTLVQRSENKELSDAITELNEQYDLAGISKNTQKLGYDVETCGVGYVLIDINTEYEDGENYFTHNVLSPTCTFVVKSSLYVDHRNMLGVTFRTDEYGNRYFTCYTKNNRYDVINLQTIVNADGTEEKPVESKWEHSSESGDKNPLGMIPIIEYVRSHDKMGCFERQLSEMNNLNLLISDFTNDVEQNTQAIWHTNDVDFPTEQVVNEDGTVTEVQHKAKTNDWLQTYTTPEGKTPFVKPLSIEYDYRGMLENILTRRALILQKCNVPQRNDNSGGSTGIAMSDATGWSAAETSATKQQSIIDGCKMEEVKVVLRAIKKHPDISADCPLLKLKYSDIKPNTNRQKNYELTTKVNFFATAVSHGINGLHALKAMNAFEDVNQVWEDSRELIKKYQSSIFDKTENTDVQNEAVGGMDEQKPNSDRLEQDKSDQESNSPVMTGQK